ncbi:MAG: thiol-disulfide oxidoreductase DCC family protein [Bacteroidia bacterium]
MTDVPFQNHGIILFDGVCNYCSRWVDIIIKHDKKDYFRFATLQSETAKKLLNQKGIGEVNFPDSVILIEKGKLFLKSDAGLEVFRKVGFPFSILYCLIVFPKSIRDGIYDFIANNRYKWFGKKEVCRIPETDVEKRKFLS